MREDPSHDVSALSTKLAGDQASAEEALDSIIRRIDTMVLAVGREDWHAVGQLSHQLAENARHQGYRAISAMAKRVCAETAKTKNPIGIKRSLIRLVGTQGRLFHRAGD